MNDGTKETTTIGEVLRESVLAGPWEMRSDFLHFEPPPSRGFPQDRKKKNHLFSKRARRRSH